MWWMGCKKPCWSSHRRHWSSTSAQSVSGRDATWHILRCCGMRFPSGLRIVSSPSSGIRIIERVVVTPLHSSSRLNVKLPPPPPGIRRLFATSFFLLEKPARNVMDADITHPDETRHAPWESLAVANAPCWWPSLGIVRSGTRNQDARDVSLKPTLVHPEGASMDSVLGGKSGWSMEA